MAHITGVAFILGLILAASDGPLFPWVNLFGLAVFATVPVLARRIHVR